VRRVRTGNDSQEQAVTVEWLESHLTRRWRSDVLASFYRFETSGESDGGRKRPVGEENAMSLAPNARAMLGFVTRFSRDPRRLYPVSNGVLPVCCWLLLFICCLGRTPKEAAPRACVDSHGSRESQKCMVSDSLRKQETKARTTTEVETET
jgi:hypothetical protein